MDLDGDGHEDLLACSMQGLIYNFAGKTGSSFKAGEILRNKDGGLIGLEVYFNLRKEMWANTKTDEPQGSTSHLIDVATVDWDNDGDLDLLLAGLDVFLLLNEGTLTKPAFAIDNIPVKVAGGDQMEGSTVEVADWDGDGLWDIVASHEHGWVHFHKNVGKLGAPAFAQAKQLLSPNNIWRTDKGELPTRPGQNVQIEVVDYNGDGKLDLLLGDFRGMPQKAKWTAEEIALRDKLQEEWNDCYAQIGELTKELEAKHGAENRMAIVSDQRWGDLHEKANFIMFKLRKYTLSNSQHGYLWLMLRK